MTPLASRPGSLVTHPPRIGLTLAAGLALTLLWTAGPVAAQSDTRSESRGLVIGGHFEGASLAVEDAERSNGGGGGGTLGWVFGNGLGVFTRLDVADVDVRNQPDTEGTWRNAHLDLGLRYHFVRPRSTFVPYLQAAYTIHDVKVTDVALAGADPTDEFDVRGWAVTGGAGVMLHVVPSFAFDIGLMASWGQLEDWEINGQAASGVPAIDNQTTRLNLGVAWWPLG